MKKKRGKRERRKSVVDIITDVLEDHQVSFEHGNGAKTPHQLHGRTDEEKRTLFRNPTLAAKMIQKKLAKERRKSTHRRESMSASVKIRKSPDMSSKKTRNLQGHSLRHAPISKGVHVTTNDISGMHSSAVSRSSGSTFSSDRADGSRVTVVDLHCVPKQSHLMQSDNMDEIQEGSERLSMLLRGEGGGGGRVEHSQSFIDTGLVSRYTRSSRRGSRASSVRSSSTGGMSMGHEELDGLEIGRYRSESPVKSVSFFPNFWVFFLFSSFAQY